MRATVLLCDYAQAVNGKLSLLGAGWNVTGPDPVTFGVAVQIHVPPDDTGFTHSFRVRLLNDAGVLVQFQAGQHLVPAIDVASSFIIKFEETPLTETSAVLALNASGVPLQAGVYHVIVEVDGQRAENGSVSFAVRKPLPPLPPPVRPPRKS